MTDHDKPMSMVERVARAYEPSLWRQIDSDLAVKVRVGAANLAKSASLKRGRAAIAAMRDGLTEDMAAAMECEFSTDGQWKVAIDAALTDPK